MGILDALFSVFSKEQPNPNQKRCTACWWSGYQGRICKNASPEPTAITTVNQAQLCENYTTDEPIKELKTSIETLPASLPPRMTFLTQGGITKGSDATLQGTDNTVWTAVKALVFKNLITSNTISQVLVGARVLEGQTGYVKVTVEDDFGEVEQPAFGINGVTVTSETEQLFLKNLFQEYLGETVVVRVYLRGAIAMGVSIFTETLVVYGVNRQSVEYAS